MMNELTRKRRDELTSEYIDTLLESMSTSDLMDFVYEKVHENLDKYSDEELVSEVQTYYPHLLDLAHE